MLALIAFISVTASHGQASSEATFEHYKAFNNIEFDYTILMPASYDADQEYPALFVFSDGEMDRESVSRAAEDMFGSSAAAEWLIILPTIPEDSWHTHPAHHALEAFLEQIKDDYNVEGDTFHLTSFGEGSRAGITYASMSSTFWSSFTFTNPRPWENWQDRDIERASDRNKHISYRVVVGENDQEGKALAEKVAELFSKSDAPLTIEVVAGEGTNLRQALTGLLMAEVQKNAGR